MPVQVSYPGVYIQEVSSGSRTITGTSTSIALFIGQHPSGPMNTPIRTLSVTEFRRIFGPDEGSSELGKQIEMFFFNGGSQAWVIRIAQGAAPATVELHDEAGDPTLELKAYNWGTTGTAIRAKVDYDTAEPEQTFNMRVEQVEVDGLGNITVAASELHKDLTMDPSSGNYVVSVLDQQSSLVRGTVLNADANPAYSLWGIVETSADDTTALSAAISGAEGKFRVSVDGSPFKTVTLSNSVADTTEIQAAFDAALMGTGKSVTVSNPILAADTRYMWQIQSDADGGFVTFASANEDDMAVAAQMGTANGGIDVGGYAHSRPAASGLFGRLDVGTAANLHTNLEAWLGQSADAVSLEILDTLDSQTLTATVPSAALTELASLRAALDTLAADVNANAERWTAAVHGYRLILTPNFGGSDSDHTAYVSTEAALETTYFWDQANAGNTAYYQLGSFGINKGAYQTGTSAGNNGIKPGLDEYAAAYVLADQQIDLFNILVLPRADGQSDADRLALWGPASAAAKSGRAVLIVDPDSSWSSANDVVDPTTGVTSLRTGVVLDHSTLSWPRIRVSGDGGGLRTIDACGAMAGIMARTDVARGVWKAPAGLEANFIAVRGVEHAMSDAENGLINPQAVNAVRAFPAGIVSWGARTMVGYDNSGNDDYKYLPVRRLALHIEESLYRGLQWAVFEPNDAPLWRQLRQSAGSFMDGLFRRGAFAGGKASDAYFVKVDSETTTQTDVNLGIVNVIVGFAPLKPAEFVVVTLQQMAGQTQA